jgi:hypothetical protein
MYTQFEEKGKIFTNVISKRPIPVTIQTTIQIIKGKFHVRPEGRLKDELNTTEEFLAVTDAEIYDLNKNLQYECAFLSINRSHIIWLAPDEDLLPSKETEK